VTRSLAKARPEIPLFSNLQEASSNEIRSAGIGTPSESLSVRASAFCSTERQLCTRQSRSSGVAEYVRWRVYELYSLEIIRLSESDSSGGTDADHTNSRGGSEAHRHGFH